MTEAIKARMAILKNLDAGDDQCRACLKMSIHSLRHCKRCIADTPRFTQAVNALMNTKGRK